MFLVYSFKLYLTNCIPRIYEMYLNDTTDFFFSCYEANSDQVFHCLGYFFVSSLLTQGEPSS